MSYGLALRLRERHRATNSARTSVNAGVRITDLMARPGFAPVHQSLSETKEISYLARAQQGMRHGQKSGSQEPGTVESPVGLHDALELLHTVGITHSHPVHYPGARD